MAEVITRLEEVRPGDIYLGPIGGWFGPLISAGELLVDGGFHVGPLDVRHIGIVVEASQQLGPAIRENATGVYTELDEKAARVYKTYGTSQAFTHYPTGVSTAPRLAQAMPGGAEIVDMTYAQHWTPQCAYARLPEDYPGQADDAAAVARLMVQEEVGYSYGSYPALAAWHWGLSTPRLEAWIGRRREPTVLKGSTPDGPQPWPWAVSLPVEAICSVFADQAWSLTGKKIMVGVPHQCVTPSQLGARLLAGLDDVIWGWPAAHPYP